MSEIDFFSFFCEDVRWEVSGAPIFIGVMSPVFQPESYPLKFNSINIITIFRSSLDVKEVQADLLITKISSSGEKLTVGDFESKFTPVDSELEGLQWTAISALPLHDLEFAHGDSLHADLTVEGITKKVTLVAGSQMKSDY